MSELKIRDVATSQLDELDQERLQCSLEWERTVVAREAEAAEEVAKRVDKEEAELVVVVDEDGKPSGLVDPEQVRAEAARRSGRAQESMRQSLREIEAGEGAERTFELLRLARPSPYWCAIGEHYTSRPPCRHHEIREVLPGPEGFGSSGSNENSPNALG